GLRWARWRGRGVWVAVVRLGGGGGGGGGGAGFSLGEAFGVLKQALGRLGAGEHSVSADEVRDTMLELAGGPATPLEPERFPKLLDRKSTRLNSSHQINSYADFCFT